VAHSTVYGPRGHSTIKRPLGHPAVRCFQVRRCVCQSARTRIDAEVRAMQRSGGQARRGAVDGACKRVRGRFGSSGGAEEARTGADDASMCLKHHLAARLQHGPVASNKLRLQMREVRELLCAWVARRRGQRAATQASGSFRPAMCAQHDGAARRGPLRGGCVGEKHVGGGDQQAAQAQVLCSPCQSPVHTEAVPRGEAQHPAAAGRARGCGWVRRSWLWVRRSWLWVRRSWLWVRRSRQRLRQGAYVPQATQAPTQAGPGCACMTVALAYRRHRMHACAQRARRRRCARECMGARGRHEESHGRPPRTHEHMYACGAGVAHRTQRMGSSVRHEMGMDAAASRKFRRPAKAPFTSTMRRTSGSRSMLLTVKSRPAASLQHTHACQ
jgi:hypothetical protein